MHLPQCRTQPPGMRCPTRAPARDSFSNANAWYREPARPPAIREGLCATGRSAAACRRPNSAPSEVIKTLRPQAARPAALEVITGLELLWVGGSVASDVVASVVQPVAATGTTTIPRVESFRLLLGTRWVILARSAYHHHPSRV
jgi:hypothetical protein